MAILQLLICCATTILIANVLELTPQLLSAAAAANSVKTKPQFSPFPLDGVDLPMEVEQDADEDASNDDLEQPTPMHHALPPPWLQFDEPPQQKQRSSAKSTLIKLPPAAHKHPSHTHTLSQTHHTHSSERHCNIVISSKISGICTPMPPAGSSPCVSGEYMDMWNSDCM